jgi:alpha-L-arabinofuranosidase
MITGAVTAKNDFDSPQAVSIQQISAISIVNDGLKFTLPPCSVAELVVS